ncbi:hypothetical protein FIBSPDRAFT_1038204 [Athelia psychrophila]|uniref:Fungal-type protein kinase domain-containing protein n=1 Tax=Athelia psychrophila TaxID=1759441 RepID=A0A166TF10_9AGAM|nr:hypothetical protein FIBSPDRAFT_1038204 [Fibularhizoctonia sp. CBS 109695]
MITWSSLESIIYERATLLGHATCVQRVTVTRGCDSLPGKWVLEVARLECTRLSEVEILKKAVELGEKDEREEKRNETGEEKKQARFGSRRPRLPVFKELDGIETLNSDELLKAFADIVDCKHTNCYSLCCNTHVFKGHYALWTSGGIKHSDISPGILTWNPRAKSGVLNGYDLSRMVPHSPNPERTGTIPFLSLDLLRNNLDFRQGSVEPTYKHDCDSLKWAFLYCVEKRSEVCTWPTADMKTSLSIRTLYLNSLRPFQGSLKHATLSQHSQTVFWLLQDPHLAVLNHVRAFIRGTGPEVYVGDTDVELYSALKSSIQRLPVGGPGGTS